MMYRHNPGYLIFLLWIVQEQREFRLLNLLLPVQNSASISCRPLPYCNSNRRYLYMWYPSHYFFHTTSSFYTDFLPIIEPVSSSSNENTDFIVLFILYRSTFANLISSFIRENLRCLLSDIASMKYLCVLNGSSNIFRIATFHMLYRDSLALFIM